MKTEAEQLWAEGPAFFQAEHARLTTDTVLLADFARVRGRVCGADLGCASGALMLMLLWREQGAHMTGFELNPEAASLAEKNMQLNGLEGRSKIRGGDFRETVKQCRSGSFDFVISNPPYFEPDRGLIPPEENRAAARTEQSCSLAEVCEAAARLCRSGGCVFFCYRPEGLNRLLREMSARRLEPKRIRFVHHRQGKEAGLVLAEGRKNGNPGLKVEAPLILFTEDGQETAEYQRIYHR